MKSNRLCQTVADQRVLKAQAFSRANLRGTTIVAAIEAWKRDKGSYPPNLDALATDLPKDPFTGAAFGYTPEGSGYILYSAGTNRADDGGKGNPWDPKQDDYVIARRQ